MLGYATRNTTQHYSIEQISYGGESTWHEPSQGTERHSKFLETARLQLGKHTALNFSKSYEIIIYSALLYYFKWLSYKSLLYRVDRISYPVNKSLLNG